MKEMRTMSSSLNLSVHCHINQNGNNDRFVGIKIDTNKAMVYFPIGYRLSDNDDGIRQDILLLIAVLSIFSNYKDGVVTTQKFEMTHLVNFPINAYINIVRYFLQQNTYYMEKEQIMKVKDSGKIDWSTSLRRNISFFQKDGTPFFERYTVKGSTTNENNLITQIHKYCVFEAFTVIGWLFTSNLPPNPHIKLDKDRFLFVLRKKLGVTYNDNDKQLFQAMISMIEYIDTENSEKQYYFGTDRFEYVWEKLIDEAFGIKSKEEYFPRTQWNLKYGSTKNNFALEPDSIMIHDNKVYVLDAKYYRYGISGIPNHLPESTSINKQITYGEYIKNCQALKDKYGDRTIYNAFLMPYNKDENPFDIQNQYFANIGEATGEWKNGKHFYERVQGIVIDIRFLMKNYYGSQTEKIQKLAKVIEEALAENGQQFP